jgi:hypothetical protein
MSKLFTSLSRLWEFKKYKEHQWFAVQITLLVALSLFYLFAHYLLDHRYKKGCNYEYSKLDGKQMLQINKIYFDSSSLKAVYKIIPVSSFDSSGNLLTKPAPIDINRLHQKALLYITNEFINKIDYEQLESVKEYLALASPMEAVTFFSDFRFKVESNFWLVGPYVYWEIVFWSWFGVIASIIFNLGLIGQNRTTDPTNAQTVFDSSEIPHQVAKLLYAPLCTLVIVFGYNFFKDQNIVDISSSKGVIVFAFIGGFYSSRLIAFLDRLKEVLLPTNSASTVQSKTQNPISVEFENIKIELQLDESITGDLRNEIIEKGFNDAEVVLENEATGEKIKAEAPTEDQSSTFTIPKIKPGNYLVNVNWSKEVVDEIVNLTANKKIEIKNPEEVVVVDLGKSESSG